MNGAFLNALGILLGALGAMLWPKPMSARVQLFFRALLGVVTLFAGAWMVVANLGTGFSTGVKRFLIDLLALLLGYWLGKLLHLQKMSNWLGRYAGRLIANAQAHPPGKPAAGLTACVLLFGAAPLGWVGAVQDGLTGHCFLMGVKAAMDALAMAGFVKIFGWPVALSAFPVFALFGALTLACQKFAAPFCMAHQLLDSVSATSGLVACAVSLVVFEVRRVELANFLPAVAIAPLLEWFWT